MLDLSYDHSNFTNIHLNCFVLELRFFKTKQLRSGLVKLLQGGPYVFERFLEAALRPWIDSDKNFVDKKNCLGIYLLKVIKQIFGKVHHGLWSFQNEFQLALHIHNMNARRILTEK